MGFGGYLQANTAVDVLIGPFVDDTDGKTAETGLTLSQADIKLSKNGQALAQKNDDTAAAHDANGYYNCELDATDTNTEGTLTLIVHESGALPVRHDFMVLAQAAYISHITAKDAGFMDVNIKTVGRADTQETEANNLESACANYSATRGLTGTALPAAAADAAGGVPISDAGGLDIDAKLANTNEVTAARMGALTDWINGGRLDLILDDILTDTGTTLDGKLNTIDDFLDTEVAAILADTNELQTDFVNGGRLDLLIDAIKAKTDNLPADPADDSDIDTQLAAIAGYIDTEVAAILAAVDTEIAAIKAKTDNLPASPAAVGDIPTTAQIKTAIEAAGSHLALILEDTGTTLDGKLNTIDDFIDTEIGTLTTELAKVPKSDGTATWNATALASLQSEATDALNAYDPPTKAELDTAVANVSVDEIQASALADLFNTNSGTNYAAAVAGSPVKEIADNAGGSALTAAGIADAVWDEAISGHLGAGTTGNALNAAGSAGDPWSTPIPGSYGAGTAGKILGDNINAPIATIDTVVDAIKAKTDNLPSDPADQSAVEAAITSAHSTTNSKIDTVDDFLDTEIAAILADTNELQTDLVNGGRLDLLIDAIKAKTDNLPTDPADQSAVEAAITAAHSTTNSKIDAVDDYVDTEVAAIKAKTDLIPASPAAVGSAMTLANGSITAAVIASGAIDADAIAADAVTEIQSGLATAAALDAVDNYVDTEVAAIKAKTDLIPASPAAVGDIPTTAQIKTAIEAAGGHLALILEDTGTTLDGKINTIDDFLDTEIAAIKAKTDNLPADPASETNVNANETKIDTIDAVVDAIKAKTDSLTFTKTGEVDSNIQSINDTVLTGNGSTGTPWGAA